MKLLLDTHTFIWCDSAPEKLSERIRDLFEDETNILLLSVASIWEMQIKLQAGKLKLNLPLADLIESQRQHNSIELLPITLQHVLALEPLPAHHKDPFDRPLIAQANVENAVLISRDTIFSRYSVRLVW